MKHSFLTAMALLAMAALPGCKKCDPQGCQGTAEYAGHMQVIKDCTGNYLRFGQKDYLVCNFGLLASYNSGDWITASFDRTDTCSAPAYGICNMYHKNEGLVKVVCVESAVSKD